MSLNPDVSRSTSSASMHILGISAFYHDSAACLVRDGKIVAAAQEERFTRKKHDPGFPKQAIEYCLREAGIRMEEVNYVAFYEKPFLKFDRLLHSYLAYAPAGLPSFLKAIPIWIKEKIWMKELIKSELGNYEGKILFPEHHESHAASAFFPSPFQEAAFLTVDGVGEWATTSIGFGKGNSIEILEEQNFPHSLGLLYSAFTYYTGFTVNSGEYKLMGLAPYGEPVYKDVILRELIDLKEDGSFKLNMRYFNYGAGLTMTNDAFHRLFGGPPRQPESRLTRRDMDVGRSIQEVTEEIIRRMARHVHRLTGQKNLCMAGGVALNCVANGKLLCEGPFENIWIQPAAGDAGGALGAALAIWHQYLGNPRQADGVHDAQQGSLLGPSYSKTEIRQFLESRRVRFSEFTDDELPDRIADLLVEEKVIGWFHGRMEFGPRALGARSIIGDPRSVTMQAVMNLKIKFRESFRPFAPCVLREHVHHWFGMRPNEDSPYMLQVAPVLKKHRSVVSQVEQDRLRQEGDLVRWVNTVRSSVPAITHVDYSARVQTVDERHGQYRRVMEKFYEKTGCPIIVNTSFNLSWEPIVCRLEEAYNTFMQSEMDVLVLGNCVLLKTEQPVGFRVWAEPEDRAQAASDSPWADPLTHEPLVVTRSGARNPVTGARYQVEGEIPRLFVPSDDMSSDDFSATEQMQIPADGEPDSVRALLENHRRNPFTRLLNEQLPFDARVVEIGCGTGELTNFLSIAHRSVLGVDMRLNSLLVGQKFKMAHGLAQAAFAQMNLLRPGLRDAFFDYVISLGVLHRTRDARRAFGRISRLVKPGGYILAGLYNRRATDHALGPLHESRHTLDQVLGWLEENELDFVNAIPKPAGGRFTGTERLFEPGSPGTAWRRFWSQWSSAPGGSRNRGFFIVIARRR